MAQSNYEDQIRDSWEGPGLSIPAISFAEHRKGDGFADAILLPTADGRFAGKGYRLVPDMEKRTISVDGKPIQNPKFGQPRKWPDGSIMTVTVLTLLTGLKTLDFDGFVSEPALEKIDLAVKGGEPDDIAFLAVLKQFGLRRLFITGGSLDPEFRKAIKAVGKAPVVGASIGVSLADLVANDHGGKTKEYSVAYGLPTVATMARVEEYLAHGAQTVNDYMNKASTDAVSTPAHEQAEDDGDTPF